MAINEAPVMDFEAYNEGKQYWLSAIEALDNKYNTVTNELLAKILNHRDKTNTHTAESIATTYADQDKLSYMKMYATPKLMAEINKNEIALEKCKEVIKNGFISLLKIKSGLYTKNQEYISYLEAEIAQRKQQSCLINEEIIAGEQEVVTLTAEVAKAQKAYDDKLAEQEELKNKLAEINTKITTASDEERDALEAESNSLFDQITDMNPELANLDSNLSIANENLTFANDKLVATKSKLSELKLSEYDQKLNEAKTNNEQLKESILNDRDEFANAGFDITDQDILNLNESTVQPPQNQPEDSKQEKDKKNKDTAKSTSGPVVQGQNALVTQTPAQRAKSVRDTLLTGDNETIKNCLANSDYSDILTNLGMGSPKEKRALASKIKSLSSPMDAAKLSNVISALQRSGMCSGLDIQSLMNGDKLKDFSKLSSNDIANLNTFMNEIEQNKAFIPQEYLGLLQNGLLNNIKYNALSCSIKPKGIKGFLTSLTPNQRKGKKEHFASLGNLSNTISTTMKPSEPTVSEPTKSDRDNKFFDILTGNVNENIQPPPPRKNPPTNERSK